MDDATIFWIVLLGSCVALTALGTLIWKRPVTAALCVTGLVTFVNLRLVFQKDAFWGMAIDHRPHLFPPADGCDGHSHRQSDGQVR